MPNVNRFLITKLWFIQNTENFVKLKIAEIANPKNIEIPKDLVL